MNNVLSAAVVATGVALAAASPSYAGNPLVGDSSGATVVADKDLAKVKGSSSAQTALNALSAGYYMQLAQYNAYYGSLYNYYGYYGITPYNYFTAAGDAAKTAAAHFYNAAYYSYYYQ